MPATGAFYTCWPKTEAFESKARELNFIRSSGRFFPGFHNRIAGILSGCIELKKGIDINKSEYINGECGGIKRRVNWHELLLRSEYGWNEGNVEALPHPSP